MSESVCGPIDLDFPLTQLADKVNQLLTGKNVEGIPYNITMELGIIVLKSVYAEALPKSLKDYLDGFEEHGDLTNDVPGVAGPLLLFGSANTRQMQQAHSVQDIADAIFRRLGVHSRVVDGVQKGLSDRRKAIVMTVFAPRGGIPDDIYDETSRLLHEVGCRPVYHQGGAYDYGNFTPPSQERTLAL